MKEILEKLNALADTMIAMMVVKPAGTSSTASTGYDSSSFFSSAGSWRSKEIWSTINGLSWCTPGLG